MNAVKITAELTLTEETFSKLFELSEDPEQNAQNYKEYVSRILHGHFGQYRYLGCYDEFINQRIEDNGQGFRVSVQEIASPTNPEAK